MKERKEKKRRKREARKEQRQGGAEQIVEQQAFREGRDCREDKAKRSPAQRGQSKTLTRAEGRAQSRDSGAMFWVMCSAWRESKSVTLVFESDWGFFQIVNHGISISLLEEFKTQLDETEGLQIRNEGKWIPVKPLPNAFVANIGDIMEIVSNGIYHSIEHRAVVNSTQERLSVAAFYSSRLDTELGPATNLIGPHNPAVFKRVPLEKYFKEFFARRLKGKSYLDFMRIQNE
ncbi:hypothetical protein L6164_001235 [Bauhinia variegata]|uniref:Uncharacterized protein n=1 Tax=Bauhinia variegata TaxID=167791 RepID=A0ACB9QFJ1_BAUVA|nr:hypothetical protein L6164_001235 [Bauhinia variegata]